MSVTLSHRNRLLQLNNFAKGLDFEKGRSGGVAEKQQATDYQLLVYDGNDLGVLQERLG